MTAVEFFISCAYIAMGAFLLFVAITCVVFAAALVVYFRANDWSKR